MIQLIQHPLMPTDYKSNGCGSDKARFDFVPDTIFGVAFIKTYGIIYLSN